MAETVNQQVFEAIETAEAEDRSVVTDANAAAGAAYQEHYHEGLEAAEEAADAAFNQAMLTPAEK
jgi:hypothetical protein